MREDPGISADRWADRIIAILGFVGGALVGVSLAPDLVSYLEPFGIDQLSFAPAAPIIFCCGLVGAVAARRPGTVLARILLILF